jgi:hypothetical protein
MSVKCGNSEFTFGASRIRARNADPLTEFYVSGKAQLRDDPRVFPMALTLNEFLVNSLAETFNVCSVDQQFTENISSANAHAR